MTLDKEVKKLNREINTLKWMYFPELRFVSISGLYAPDKSLIVTEGNGRYFSYMNYGDVIGISLFEKRFFFGYSTILVSETFIGDDYKKVREGLLAHNLAGLILRHQSDSGIVDREVIIRGLGSSLVKAVSEIENREGNAVHFPNSSSRLKYMIRVFESNGAIMD